jgi:microcystin-dependent protein
MFGFNFTPQNYAQCNGQLIAISQNNALFALIGTTYGGNGTTNFALPNLQGRTPMHFSSTTPQGTVAGAENVQITTSTMPAHNHVVNATTNTATRRVPTGKMFAADTASVADFYVAPGTTTTLAPGSVSATGSGQGHNNMQPSLVINFCIAVFGIFPTRN